MLTIAVDGPAGAGKSSIAKEIAQEMGIVYVDTGAMYRAIGLYIHRKGLDTKDPEYVIPQLKNIQIKTIYDQVHGQRIFLNEEDVSEAIRSPEMSMPTSNVSAIPEVRSFLLELQREMASKQSLIMDGRDIGTVVLPNADLKIFLTATPESRAMRRRREYAEKGRDVPYETVLQEVLDRDRQDTYRKEAPLKQAEDAVLLDTTEMNREQSVAAMKNLIKGRMKDVL